MNNILIVYWSGTGNTKKMAEEIRLGILNAGKTVTLINLKETIPEIKGFDKIMFGCPATSKEQLEQSTFMPFIESIQSSLDGINVALFGSYGWGDGEWMRKFETLIKDHSGNLFESLIIKGEPNDNDERCLAFGEKFAKL